MQKKIMTKAKFAIITLLALCSGLFAQERNSEAVTLISNLAEGAGGTEDSPFANGNVKANGFRLGNADVRVKAITLRLRLADNSKPVLHVLAESGGDTDWDYVRLNQAAGRFRAEEIRRRELAELTPRDPSSTAGVHVVEFVPDEELVLPAGSLVWLALAAARQGDAMFWLNGNEPTALKPELVSHAGQRFSRDLSLRNQSSVINFYQVEGVLSGGAERPAERHSTGRPSDRGVKYAEYSGVYPHLAMFNEENGGECGMGALVHWADCLWAVTYSPYHHRGSSDKLFRIDSDHNLAVFQRSVGGTPANRMIHNESRQLNIGPYFVDERGGVRVIPPATMPGRLTGSARHLTEPERKIYIATMEEGLYEVDVKTLDVATIFADYIAPLPGKPRSNLPGTHGKGLYSGQGR